MPLYFAYGSNMDIAAMSVRCPRSTALGPGRLMRHRFVLMADGYASVERAPRSVVHGVVWDIALADMRALDEYEAIASGLYRKIQQPVFLSEPGKPARGTRALVYVGNVSARPGSPVRGTGRVPTDYLSGVVEAARNWGLPDAYLRELEGWGTGAAVATGKRGVLKIAAPEPDDRSAVRARSPVRAQRDSEGNIIVRARFDSPLDRSSE